MTNQIAAASVTCAAILLSASFLSSAEQSSPGAPTKSAEHKQISKSTPDNWQKMKDCAAQAEKAIAERNRRYILWGGAGAAAWSNHYSPKYNRCFLKVEFLAPANATVKGAPSFYTYLEDAFEQADLAKLATGLPAQVLCRNEADPKECERGAAIVWEGTCGIEEEETDCAKAKQFIDEHMKN